MDKSTNHGFRWRTLLQYGNSWEVIGSVVMKNPGGANFRHPSHQAIDVMKEGFVLWEITGNKKDTPVFLDGNGTDIIVHVLVPEGEIKVNSGGELYLLTKDCFANFIDKSSLEVLDISGDTKAYVMLFTAPFITSLLKNSPPFPPSYVLKIKQCPIASTPSEIIELFLKRIEIMIEIFMDNTHCFQTEMLKCTLWMFMMDMANEHIRQENEKMEHTDCSILQIAEDFHFPDQATLTKFFKRQTGKTPTKYRKERTLL